ncbi:pilin [Patescibacteria group bacterium]|nr:pilin [Patescibacteria group bacterium]
MGPPPAGLNEIEQVVGNIISVIVGLGFIALLVMLVWAGFKFLTSGGEPKALQAARQTFTWALLGIVFMAVAWLILQLIAGFTGIDVTKFNIKTLNP